MTVIDVAAALSEGSMPTNAQLLAFLRRLEKSDALTRTADPDYADQVERKRVQRTLITNIREIIFAVETLVQDKNADEELQNLVWNLRGQTLQLGHEVSEEVARRRQEDKEAKKARRQEKLRKAKDVKGKVSRATLRTQETGTLAYKHLLTLLRIALVQPELRHILADFGLLALEIVDQTASDTFGEDARRDLGQAVDTHRGTVEGIIAGVKASHSTLSSIDLDNIRNEAIQVASQHAQDRLASTSAQLPNLVQLQGRVLSTFQLIQRKKRGEKIEVDLPSVEELRELLRDELNAGLEIPQELKGLLSPHEAQTSPTSNTAPLETATTIAPTAQQSVPAAPQPPLSRTDIADLIQLLGVDSLLAKGADFKSTLSEAKLRAADASRKARVEGAKNAKMAWKQQGKQRLIDRSRKLLIDVQSQESSKQAFLWFIDVTEAFIQWAASVTIEVPGSVATRATAAWDSLGPGVAFLEKLAGGQEIRPILDIVRRLSIGFREEPALRDFIQSVDQYLRDCLLKQGWVLTDECKQEGQGIVDSFKSLRAGYREDIRTLVTKVRSLFHKAPRDPAIHNLLRSFKRLGKDLTLGPRYWYIPKPHVWHDLCREILPPLFAKAGVLPVPRIKYTHPDFVLTLENIALSLSDLIPNTIDFRTTNDVHVDVKHVRESFHFHSIKIKIKGMGMRLHKVAFAVELLKGIKFHDKGILDLLIRDVGLSILIDVPKDYSQHFFTVRSVKGKLGKLQIAVRKSNHAILHKLAEALVDSKLTKLILRNLMAKGVTIGLKQLDVALMQWRLNPREPDDRKHLVRLKQQAAELRDLMVKLREQAGTLEIDLLERRDDGTVGNSQLQQWEQETHLLRWLKQIFRRTGTREVVRDEWRSNAFDMTDDAESKSSAPGSAAPAQVSSTAAAAATSTSAEQQEGSTAVDTPASSPEQATETQAEAEAQGKPQGPTTEATVEDADAELHKQKQRHAGWFFRRSKKTTSGAGDGSTETAKSKTGRKAEKQGLSTKKQVEALEHSVGARDESGRPNAQSEAQG